MGRGTRASPPKPRHAGAAPFLSELRRALREDCRVPPGARLLIAVSGGPDSTALLFGLAQLARSDRLRLSAAHLHHGLRGAAADADLRLVRSHCRRLGIPLAAARWDARARMARRGLTGQAGLRTLRREFLAAAQRRHRAEFIVTGHTADDQVETFLLRLARGAGLPGLAAIAPRRRPYVRPMLGIPRAEVLRFLEAAGTRAREDRSNRDLKYARNRVRARVLPELARAQRLAGTEALARAAARSIRELRFAARTLRSAGIRVFAAHAHQKGSLIRLDCGKLGTYASPIRREALRRAWAGTGVTKGLTLRHLEALDRLIETPASGARIHLPGGHVARRDGPYLYLSSQNPGEPHARHPAARD